MPPERSKKTCPTPKLDGLISICETYRGFEEGPKNKQCRELASRCDDITNATSDDACQQFGLLLGGRPVTSSTTQFQKPSGVSDVLWEKATGIYTKLKSNKSPVSQKIDVPYDYDIWFHGGCGGRDFGFKQKTPTTVTIDPEGNIYFSIYSENEVFLYPGTIDASYKSEFKHSPHRRYLYDASKGNDSFIECARRMKDSFIEAAFLARGMIQKEQKTFAYLGGNFMSAEGFSFQKDGESWLKISGSSNTFYLNDRGLFIENGHLGREIWAESIYKSLCSTTPSSEVGKRICWVFEQGGIILYDPRTQKGDHPLSLTRVTFQKNGETKPISGPYTIE